MAKPSKSDNLDNLPSSTDLAKSASSDIAKQEPLSKAQQILLEQRALDAADAEEGFERVNPLDAVRIFYKPEKDVMFQGVVLGRYTRNDVNDEGEIQYYYQVQLTLPYAFCSLEKEDYEAQVGDIVNVDERFAMKVIADAFEVTKREGLNLEIRLRALGKVKTSRGKNSVWRFDIKGRKFGKKAPQFAASSEPAQLTS